MTKKISIFFLSFILIIMLGGCMFSMDKNGYLGYSDQLYHAIVDNDEEEFERLLAEKGDLNQPRSTVNFADYKNVYPLEAACEKSVSMAYRLLEEGADPMIVDDYLNSTPLIFCLCGTDPLRYELAMKLIELGADPEHVDDNGRTVLNHIAAIKKNDTETTNQEAIELMQYMFDHCDVDKIMEESMDSPLNSAVKYGNIEMVKYILDNKLMDVNQTGQGGRTPLMDSIRSDNIDMYKLLISYGASKEGKCEDGMTCMDYAEECGDQELIALLKEE